MAFQYCYYNMGSAAAAPRLGAVCVDFARSELIIFRIALNFIGCWNNIYLLGTVAKGEGPFQVGRQTRGRRGLRCNKIKNITPRGKAVVR